MTENEIGTMVVDACVTVRALGPGLLESVYEAALAYELTAQIARAAAGCDTGPL